NRGVAVKKLSVETPPVTPTAHAKTIGIDQAARNRGIDRREIVREIDTPPGGEDAEGEFFATTSGAARIRHDYGVAVGGKNLHLKLELIRKLRCRTAVRSQYPRRLHPGGKIDRVNEKAVHFGAVFAFEFCFLNAREFELPQPHIVLLGYGSQIVFLGCQDFIEVIRGPRTHHRFSILPNVISGRGWPPATPRCGRAAGNWNA